MDLNPDQAIEAGWLSADSQTTRFLQSLLHFSLHHSESVVTLDRFMAKRVLDKGVDVERVTVLPPWSHDHSVEYDPAGREAFRERHGLSGKFVVMYSGNHSPCHPLDTLLASALELRDQPDVAFCFVGGGSEFLKVLNFREQHGLPNVICLPYEPLDQLSASLSAADLHTVVMGDPFVGIVHPSKVYNILSLGIPFVYVGPEESHVTELSHAGSFRHGEPVALAASILRKSQERTPRTEQGANPFSCDALISRMVTLIERSAAPAIADTAVPRSGVRAPGLFDQTDP